jgi:formiminotetrahydrofolate cyclodeaminase
VCGDVVRLAGRAAEVGNQNVISDAGVGVLAAWAALRSAVLNVNINAPSLKDRAFAEAKLAETQALLAECGPLSEQIHGRVQARLG